MIITKLQVKNTQFNLIKMNRLKIYTGGFPLMNDDIDFLQNQIIAPPLYNIIRGFSDPTGYIILWGCEAVLNNGLSTAATDVYDISEGAVVYAYEVVSCPGQQISVPKNAALQMRVITDTPPTGARQYIDTSTHFTYEVDSIVVEEYDQQGYELTDFERLPIAIKDLLLSTIATKQLGFAMQNGWNVIGSLDFHKELKLKYLQVKLATSQAFINAQASGQSPFTQTVFVLPTEAAPLKPVSFLCKYHGYSTQGGGINKVGYAVIDIDDQGLVTATKIDDEQNKSIIDINVSYL